MAHCNKAFQGFPFVIHSPPKVVRLDFNLNEHLIQVPLPIQICAHLADPFLADLNSKQWAKAVSPKPNRLIADVDAAFVQKILNLPKRQQETDIHHKGQTDDLWARFEVTKGGTFCNPQKISPTLPVSTDFALTVPEYGT